MLTPIFSIFICKNYIFCRYDEELAQQDAINLDKKLGPGAIGRGRKDGSRPSPATWK